MDFDPVKARAQVSAAQQKRMSDMASTSETTAVPKRIEEGLEDLRRGSIAPIGNVTLRTSQTTTTVTAPYLVSSTSCVLLMPLDSTTATEYGLGTTYVTPAKGSFQITHPSNGATRTYRWVAFSGIRV